LHYSQECQALYAGIDQSTSDVDVLMDLSSNVKAEDTTTTIDIIEKI